MKMMHPLRLALAAALAAAFLCFPARVPAHEGAVDTFEPASLPEIARSTVYTFHGDSLDTRRWRIARGPGAGRFTSSPELQYYTPEAVKVDRGVLHLSAMRLGVLDPAYGTDYDYQSGRIESTQTFLYGRIDVRMKVPIGDGFWPAVWLRTPPSAGPINGQIDIFDGFGSHTDGMTASIDNWQRGRLIAQNCIIVENFAANTVCKRIGNPLRRRVNYAMDYHTFGIDWQPDHITWFVDGHAYWTVTNGVPTVPMMLVMDLTIGGTHDGPPTRKTKFGADFEIASVSVSR